MADDVEGQTRLAAANRARWEAKTEKMAADLVARLAGMPKPMLAALAVCVVDEVERRSWTKESV